MQLRQFEELPNAAASVHDPVMFELGPARLRRVGKTGTAQDAKKPGLSSETGLFLGVEKSDQPRVRERIMKLS
jgi:hypothetical protein